MKKSPSPLIEWRSYAELFSKACAEPYIWVIADCEVNDTVFGPGICVNGYSSVNVVLTNSDSLPILFVKPSDYKLASTSQSQEYHGQFGHLKQDGTRNAMERVKERNAVKWEKQNHGESVEIGATGQTRPHESHKLIQHLLFKILNSTSTSSEASYSPLNSCLLNSLVLHVLNTKELDLISPNTYRIHELSGFTRSILLYNIRGEIKYKSSIRYVDPSIVQ